MQVCPRPARAEALGSCDPFARARDLASDRRLTALAPPLQAISHKAAFGATLAAPAPQR